MLAALAIATSCTTKGLNPETPVHNSANDKIFLWLDAPEETKVTYADSLGISGKGEKGFSMSWEVGDSLYAIRWKDGKATNEYIVLETTEINGEGKMLFQGTTRGPWNLDELEGGEHFILVHGHFVLDPTTDNGVFDFPTSEVTKDNYASHIHHGGIEDGNGGLTFRNQTGTLANLKWHEYMVADSYVRFQEVTEQDEEGNNVNILRPYLAKTAPSNSDESNTDPEKLAIKMLSAHTLLRLTMFMPDNMFDEIDYRLLGVSLRTESNDQIFHRYFRLHPNSAGVYGPSGWKVDWNDNSDKEANVYFRANMPGTRKYDEINNPADKNFDPEKTVCVAGTDSKGNNGHYVTLYFSLPSRPLAADDALDIPSKLFVTAFTRTHAYRTVKSYSIAASKIKPGNLINLNVNFASGYIKTKAITDPNLGVTFAPGLIYATKEHPEDENWTYGIYNNQGEYAGLDQQTDVMGDYFIFGSIDPRQVFHQHMVNGTWQNCTLWNPNWKISNTLTVTVNSEGKAQINGTTDVAALAEIDRQNNIFTTMSKKESDRVWARIQLEAQKGINRGYYYYDASGHDLDSLRHTAHQAKGAWKNLSSDDPRKKMSSTIGIWIGIKTQPSLEEQDKYVFLPSSNQLNNSSSNMVPYESELSFYEDAEHYRYWASTDYGKQHVKCISENEYKKLGEDDKKLYVDVPTRRIVRDKDEYLHHYYLLSELTGEYSAIMKFSTNTREVGASGATCERFQVWYQTGNSFHSNSGIKPMDQTFGRVVRPVIY